MYDSKEMLEKIQPFLLNNQKAKILFNNEKYVSIALFDMGFRNIELIFHVSKNDKSIVYKIVDCCDYLCNPYSVKRWWQIINALEGGDE